MTQKSAYTTGPALRAALEERLKRIAREENIDLQRLRRQVAFDRFLARLFHEVQTRWILKGGYAMELRFQVARATKDLDFTVRTISGITEDALHEHLQEVGTLDLKDFFSYRVGAAVKDLDGPPYGGSRHPVEAMMAQRTFVKFHLDVGIGDIVLDPLEHSQTRDWFAFAGIPPASVQMIQREQQFAEKLHAYTLPRIGTVNTPVRDLVDMLLLIQSETLQGSAIVEAVRRTFDRRATHPVPVALIAPPSGWSGPFRALADECQLSISVDEDFARLSRFYSTLPRSKH